MCQAAITPRLIWRSCSRLRWAWEPSCVGRRPDADRGTAAGSPSGEPSGVGGRHGTPAIAVAMPWGPMDGPTVNRIAADRAIQADAARAVMIIAPAHDQIPGSRDRPASDVSVTVPSHRRPVLLVPGLLRPRMAVDLGLPLDFGGQVQFGSLLPQRSVSLFEVGTPLGESTSVPLTRSMLLTPGRWVVSGLRFCFGLVMVTAGAACRRLHRPPLQSNTTAGSARRAIVTSWTTPPVLPRTSRPPGLAIYSPGW